MIRKPMLAESIFDETRRYSEAEVRGILQRLRYPLLLTPKLDGIRTLMIEGRAVSRSLKPVPNTHTRELLEQGLPDGIDGEFIIEGETFNNISGAWRRESGKPAFRYCAFDYVGPGGLAVPYLQRMVALGGLQLPEYCDKLLPVTVDSPEDVLRAETICLEQGYEGVMLRDPHGPYKCGRSTLKEGWLLKFKRFHDGEARIIGFEELYRNKNEAITNALGHTERSMHKANMMPAGTLGALVVKGVTAFKGVEFNIGTGFDLKTRQHIWDNRDELVGALVNFSYQDIGGKDKPRFPKFRGLRDPLDM